MSNYSIDFTDPLSTSFSIPAGGYDGPGGRTATTSLRLYGQGAREYGEAVDEDLVKLLENFMGATAPLNPVNGQLWIETKLYYYDTDGEIFYSFNLVTTDWETATVTVSASEPSGVTNMHWYDNVNEKLYMFFQAYKQQPAEWHERVLETGEGAPGGISPRQTAKVYDVSVGDWMPLSIVNVTTEGAAPANGAIGTFRYDPIATVLYYWNGDQWAALASTSNPIFTGDIDVNSFKLINVGTPTVSTDAATKGYSDSTYVAKAGSTMTGPLVLSGAPSNAAHAATKAYVDATASSAAGGVSTFPPGGIIMWSPSAGSIPAGWVLCNGSNGTPDLRDKFVMAAGVTYTAGATGGSANAIAVAHTHAFSAVSGDSGVHTHTGTTSVVADHTHSVYDHPTSVTSYSAGAVNASTAGAASADVTGAAGAHSHSFTTAVSAAHSHVVAGTTASGGASGTNANLPPFVAVAYIMKT